MQWPAEVCAITPLSYTLELKPTRNLSRWCSAYVQGETLAQALAAAPPAGAHAETAALDGVAVTVGVVRR